MCCNILGGPSKRLLLSLARNNNASVPKRDSGKSLDSLFLARLRILSKVVSMTYRFSPLGAKD